MIDVIEVREVERVLNEMADTIEKRYAKTEFTGEQVASFIVKAIREVTRTIRYEL